jgi:hypothetical protein
MLQDLERRQPIERASKVNILLIAPLDPIARPIEDGHRLFEGGAMLSLLGGADDCVYSRCASF